MVPPPCAPLPGEGRTRGPDGRRSSSLLPSVGWPVHPDLLPGCGAFRACVSPLKSVCSMNSKIVRTAATQAWTTPLFVDTRSVDSSIKARSTYAHTHRTAQTHGRPVVIVGASRPRVGHAPVRRASPSAAAAGCSAQEQRPACASSLRSASTPFSSLVQRITYSSSPAWPRREGGTWGIP